MMIAAVLGLVLGASQADAKPLKVFVLAGQSNMQGHVNVATFDSMADDPKTAPILKEMRGPDGKPRVCERVWISSIGCAGNDTTEQTGKVTAGFGASINEIGPEFTFALYMEKALNEPMLIIKTSWGGRSLHTNFRPPSGGPYVWSEFETARRKDYLEKAKAETLRDTGADYRRMIEHVRKVLRDIKRVVLEYDPEQGYELAGFVWFQGFNDLVSDWTYDKGHQPGGYDMYSELLADFIRDVRKDLSAPKMPFVIGVIGVGGVKEENKPSRMKHFRQAMAAPASLPEFKGNVVAVPTAPFWGDDLEALQGRMEKCWPKVDARVAAEKDTSWENKMKVMAENFTPEEWKRLRAGASNQGYHYLGAAKIMAPIGKAFAEAMVNLQKHRAIEARTLLENGQASGALPEGMVVRIAACLGALDTRATGDRVPEELKEMWEFTSNRVYRVVPEAGTKDNPYPRAESRPFDLKGLCKDLLDGKAIEIQARKGKGPEMELVGTIYRIGSRSIEVLRNGEAILDLHESNGPVLDRYRESDARAFGALYENLASKARLLFKPKANSTK
jgi:hypothetical protein